MRFSHYWTLKQGFFSFQLFDNLFNTELRFDIIYPRERKSHQNTLLEILKWAQTKQTCSLSIASCIETSNAQYQEAAQQVTTNRIALFLCVARCNHRGLKEKLRQISSSQTNGELKKFYNSQPMLCKLHHSSVDSLIELRRQAHSVQAATKMQLPPWRPRTLITKELALGLKSERSSLLHHS